MSGKELNFKIWRNERLLYAVVDIFCSPVLILVDALDMGLKRQGLAEVNDLIAHTDRGGQYAAMDYVDKLQLTELHQVCLAKEIVTTMLLLRVFSER